MKKSRIQGLRFWSNFDHPFFPVDGLNRKDITSGQENFSHWAIQIFQTQGLTSSPLFGKNTITFCNIWAGFSSLVTFLGTTHAFLKKMSQNDVEFKAESISINFKFQK